jgi:tetratricopeptide (TPR) repeat protein
MAETVSLSWTDRRNMQRWASGTAGLGNLQLQSIGLAAHQTSVETRRGREAMDRVGRTIDSMADQIERFEQGMGLRLEEQTRLLEQQTEMLSQIRDALLTPAKTRGAERVADAAQLLRRERYERALAIANEGIDADPNNPGTFFAAAWALLGLDRPDEARRHFEEARDAADGDEKSRAARQAGRAAMAAGNVTLAYQLVRDARQMAETGEERAAVDYDVAVYAWLLKDHEAAAESLEAACRYDTRYSEMALLDRNLTDAPGLAELAAAILAELDQQVAERRPILEARLHELRNQLPASPESTRSFTELAPGVRPSSDWSALRQSAQGSLVEAEQAIAASARAERLQEGLAALEAANVTLEHVERQLSPQLKAAIEEHDSAAARQTGLEAQRDHVRRQRATWANTSRLCSKIRRHNFAWIFWGAIFLAIGAALHPLAAVGIAMLCLVVVANLIGRVADSQGRQRALADERITKEIGR